ncbi:MAG: hypothetical protein OES69_06185 [Myxococcales bacterium]|nr:hypothetical protein [Myxococcales bacterium]MDH3843507.1 hypothetical protein [Myxococcales bacterium]
MFDELAVLVGVEDVGSDVAVLPVVQSLDGVQEDEATVLEPSNHLDVANGIALQEVLEELDETLTTIFDRSRVLGVPRTGVLADGLRVPVTDGFEVEALCVSSLLPIAGSGCANNRRAQPDDPRSRGKQAILGPRARYPILVSVVSAARDAPVSWLS